jgi:predicted permease
MVLDLALTTRWRLQGETVADVAYADGGSRPAVIDGLGDAPAFVARATWNLLGVLEVRPVAGRDFTLEDARSPRREILLSDAAWNARFARDPTVIGRLVGSGPAAIEIVGVLPAGFLLPSSALMERLDAVEVLSDALDRPASDGWITTAPVARLKPGVTLEEAGAELTAIAAALTEAEAPMIHQSLRRNPSLRVVPLQTGLLFKYRPYLWLIVTAVVLVLLIGCANLSALFVARSRSRDRDAAVRAALGSSRARLTAVSVLELTMVSTAGAVVALAALALVQRAVLAAVPDVFRGFAVAPSDPRLIAMTAGLALLAGLAAAIAPAWRLLRVDAIVALRRSERGGRTPHGARALLIGQTALGIVLVAGAAVTGRNVLQMLTTHPGYHARGVALVTLQHGRRLDPRVDDWPGAPAVSATRLALVEQAIAGVPGVVSVGVANRLPLLQWGGVGFDFWRTHGSEAGGVWGIGAGVFETLGARMVAGRAFTPGEAASGAPVAILSLAGARQLWPHVAPGETPGRVLDLPHHSGQPVGLTVIGVVEDMRPHAGETPSPELYVPISHDVAHPSSSTLTAVVRVEPPGSATAADIDVALDRALGPSATTMLDLADSLDAYLQQPRFQALLFAALAGIAIALSAAGLYAVAAYDAAQRRFEMSVRVALGATAAQIRRAVVGAAVQPVAIGVAIGLAGAWWAARFLQAFVFEIDARDPWALAVVATVLLATAVIAAWIPARRAARTDPAAVLRG